MEFTILEDNNLLSMNSQNNQLSEFEVYDKIFRKNYSYISPYHNLFLQHLLFDPYIKEERGNLANIVAKTFIGLIKQFIPKLSKNSDYEKIENLKYLLVLKIL